MAHTSQRRGLVGFEPTAIRHIRWIPPTSRRTNIPPQQRHTVEQMTAGSAIFLRLPTWNTLAALATIRHPADNPMKNMKHAIYRPHDTPLLMPVAPRPSMSAAITLVTSSRPAPAPPRKRYRTESSLSIRHFPASYVDCNHVFCCTEPSRKCVPLGSSCL